MQMKKLLGGLILLFLVGTIIGTTIIRQFISPYEQPELYSGSLDGAEPSETILDVPFVWQKEWYCSEASASMVLQYYDYDVTQDEVHEKIADRFESMIPPLRQYLSCDYAYLNLENLRKEINENDPIMIRLRIGKYRHTVVIVGYTDDYFLVHDPAQGAYLKANPEALLNYWEPTGYLAIIITS